MHPLEFEPRLSLITWDEFFIRANSTPAGGQSGFVQNRAFACLGWTFNKYFRVEGGYLNQYLDDATHTNNTMHHLTELNNGITLQTNKPYNIDAMSDSK